MSQENVEMASWAAGQVTRERSLFDDAIEMTMLAVVEGPMQLPVLAVH